MNNNWRILRDTEDYKLWIDMSNIVYNKIRINRKLTVGRKIGFRCQYSNMKLQEKWITIDSFKDNTAIFKEGCRFDICHIERYDFITRLNFSNLTKDVERYIHKENDKNRYIKSDEIIEAVCPDCNKTKQIQFSNLKSYGFSCRYCGDGISFPEKFISNVLDQLDLEYKTQFCFNNFNYRYDFVLIKQNIIIEVHGNQHYCGKVWKTYEEEHENDMLKYDIAVLNGYEYNKKFIVIDARNSTLEWMKNSIEKSLLSDLFDLSIIDWKQCLYFASSNLQRSVWEYWRVHVNENDELIGAKELKKVFPMISEDTIKEYLKIGNECGKCVYTTEDALSRTNSKGYYVVDLENKTEKFYKNTLIIENELKINNGIITIYCQENKENNNLKVWKNKYAFFYMDHYTSLDNVLIKHELKQQEKINKDNIIDQRKRLISVLKSIIKTKNTLISVDNSGSIEKEFSTYGECANYYNISISKIWTLFNKNKVRYYKNKLFFYKYEWESLTEDELNQCLYKLNNCRLKVLKIDRDFNEETILIQSDEKGFVKIKKTCDNTFSNKHKYKTNIVGGFYYCYPKDRKYIDDKTIKNNFNTFDKLSRSKDKNNKVFLVELQTKECFIYNSISECAKQISGNRSSIGKICNESDSKTHRYKQGKYLVYFLNQWESIPEEKQNHIIHSGKHIN